MKKRIFLCVVSTLLAFSGFGKGFGPAEEADGKIKVVSFNVRVGKADKDTPNAWDLRKKAIQPLLEAENPTVMGVQEALDYQISYISDALPGYGVFGVGRDGAEGGEAMNIYYKKGVVTPVQSGTFWLSETPDTPSKGWDASYRRIVTWAEFTVDATGKHFLYLNTHLDHKGQEARKNSLLMIRDRIAQMNPNVYPVILTADFNSETSEAIFDPIKEIMDDARVVAPVTDNLGTYNGWGKSDSMIDHIFCSDFKVLEFRTVKDSYEGVEFVSDHYPICAVLDFANVTRAHRARAAELVSRMTLEEKIAYIGGAGSDGKTLSKKVEANEDGFYIRPVERLGIPLIRMADGPQGVRNNTRSTLFASGVAAAASWNKDAVYEMGVALGQDSRARGVHILLGPGVNIYRSPLCGRNFEYMGEDPFLSSMTSEQYIRGVQSQGVMATIKHFALNNQEWDRHHVSSDADERTMNEIYFPAFRNAVDAGVASVMTSYNLVNNVHAAESEYLIKETLKGEWGFEGFVMSDWTSTYSPLGCVRSGLDIEMPKAFCMNYELLKPLLDSGVISEKDIDAKVETILASLIAYGFLDRPQLDSSIPEDNPYSREVAYILSCESAVLLKNDGALPLKPGKKNTIALMGPRAEVIPCGGGSGAVDPLYSISLYEGMQQLGSKFPVTLVKGDYDSAANRKVIEGASAVVVSVGFDKKTERENHDRTFSLPEGQDDMIEYAVAHNDNVIVVVYSGGGIDLSRWRDKVSAIVMGWYPGQEGGLAIARMLAGEFSPSGRLPMSIEAKQEDNPTWNSYYCGEPLTKRGHTNRHVTYSEGIFMGYRGYERNGVQPAYPFGYGLTYSSFEYSDLAVVPAADGFDVTFTLTNTGKYDASEVAQVYVGEVNPCVQRPAKELKGFEKVFVKKGKSEKVTIHLPSSAFAFYDVDIHDWRINPGEFRISVAASAASEDTKLQQTIKVD